MALIAELSMNQANAIKLQQEMRDKESFLLLITSRLEKGLPLPKDVETEWLKVLRDEEMYKIAAAAKAKVSSPGLQLLTVALRFAQCEFLSRSLHHNLMPCQVNGDLESCLSPSPPPFIGKSGQLLPANKWGPKIGSGQMASARACPQCCPCPLTLGTPHSCIKQATKNLGPPEHDLSHYN